MNFQFQLSQNHQDFRKAIQTEMNNSELNGTNEILQYLSNNNFITLPGMEDSKYPDYLSLVLAIEEISKTFSKEANMLTEFLFAQEVVKNYALAECKADCYQKISKLDKRINILFSEPGNYEAKTLSTKIQKVDNGYHITGQKIYGEENSNADIYIIAGILTENETSKLALVPVEANNIKFETKNVDFGSFKSSIDIATIDYVVEESKIIKNINDNLNKALITWRNLIASTSIGIAHTNLLAALNIVKTVKNSSKQALSASQGNQFVLTDMFAEIEGARLLNYFSATLIDDNKPNTKFSLMAKTQAAEAAVVAINNAASLIGNVGNIYDTNYFNLLQLAYNRQMKDGGIVSSNNIIYEEALAKR